MQDLAIITPALLSYINNNLILTNNILQSLLLLYMAIAGVTTICFDN